MLCTGEIFTAMDPFLELEGIAVDAPLQGTTLSSAAEHLLATARLHPGPVGVLGLSLGAIVAMAAAVKDPTAFAAAVLISTNPRTPRPDQMAAWAVMAERTSAGAFAQLTAELTAPLFASSRTTDSLLATGAAMARRVGPLAFIEQLRIQRSRRDLTPELPAVNARTLVLAGSRDQLCSPEMHREIAAAVPGAELQILAGAGHLMTLEDPASAARTINHWNLRKNI